MGFPAATGGVHQRQRHKFGLTYPGIGFVVWRNSDALPRTWCFRVNYLGGDMPTFTPELLPGGWVVGQYYNFLRLGPGRIHP